MSSVVITGAELGQGEFGSVVKGVYKRHNGKKSEKVSFFSYCCVWHFIFPVTPFVYGIYSSMNLKGIPLSAICGIYTNLNLTGIPLSFVCAILELEPYMHPCLASAAFI